MSGGRLRVVGPGSAPGSSVTPADLAAHEADTDHIRVSEPPPTKFVSTTGNDSFNGRWDRPFLTPAAAIASLPTPTTGRVLLGPGTFDYATTLNLQSARGLVIEGVAGNSAETDYPATILRYTASGASSAINLRSSWGVQLRNLALFYNHASFTGRLLDFRKVTSWDTSLFAVENCWLSGYNTAKSAASLVDLANAQTGRFLGCHFEYAPIGIQGKSVNGDFSNKILVADSTFIRMGTLGIKNPGESWDVLSNTFQQLENGNAGAVGNDSGVRSLAFAFNSNWLGDVNASTGTGTQVTVLGDGFFCSGNEIGGRAAATTALNVDGTTGVVICGNLLLQHTIGVDVGSSASASGVVLGNRWSSVTTPLSGTIGNAWFVDIGDGYLRIPSVAGVPVSAPAAITGLVPIVIDRTGNRICFYNGGWKTVEAG